MGITTAGWSAFTTAMGRLRAARPNAVAAVRGIGISTIFPAVLPLDRAGRPLRNALLYCDRRSLPQVHDIGAQFGFEPFAALTGNQLTSGTCCLPGIRRLVETEPGIVARTHVFGQVSTYLLHRLTGQFAVDSVQASLSGLVAGGDENRWNQTLCDLTGITPAQLPAIHPASGVVGGLAAGVARGLGLGAGIPVAAGAGDAPLAAFGGGVIGPRQLFCSAGTTDCLMVTGTRPGRNPAFCNCRYVLPHLWVSIGTMTTAGAAVKWCCDSLLHCTLDQMTAWATAAEPGAAVPTFLPYLQGERTPHWDPKANGVICGLTPASGRDQLCRAIFEGVAYGWRQIVSMLETEFGFRADEILAVGGGSTNRFWNRIKASVLGRPITVLNCSETTVLGAAMLGGLAAGVYNSPEAARDATAALRTAETVPPEPDWQDAYDRGFSKYLDLYPRLRDWFT